MAKKKEFKIISPFKILFDGIILYFKNIDKFLKYMAFPVLGQLIGAILIFTTVYLFSSNIEKIVQINPALNNVSVMMITMLVLTIPSFIIFFTAFWKYLVAMGSLNSMANNLINGAKLEDLNIHDDTVNRRLATYLGLIFIISTISIIGFNPLLFVILVITMIYLCLVFQIFAFEENLGTFGIIKKSVQMVKGNFLQTSILLLLLYFTTYQIMPKILSHTFEYCHLYKFICIPIEAFCKNLPLQEIQNTIQTILSAINNNATFTLSASQLAKEFAIELVCICVICFTLPLRSICCSLLYKDIETTLLKEKKIKEL